MIAKAHERDDLHSWQVTPKQAVAIEKQMRVRVVSRDEVAAPRRIAGVDVGFERCGKITRAAVIVLTFPELELVDFALARRPTVFPYVPGLLSFREVPAILDALDELEAAPELVLCDGHGLAHPRRFGSACHLGVTTGIACIGVAKTRLCGSHDQVLACTPRYRLPETPRWADRLASRPEAFAEAVSKRV